MAEECAERYERDDLDGGAQQARNEHGDPSLRGVAQQSKERRAAIAAAQHIRGPDVPGSIRARVGEAHGATHEDRERNRSEEIGAERVEDRRHARSIQ
jgi:hypothetical protein